MPGDVLYYLDSNRNRHIRIKIHGSSTLRGKFFIVTTVIDEDADKGQCDREVTTEEIEKMVQRRICHS